MGILGNWEDPVDTAAPTESVGVLGKWEDPPGEATAQEAPKSLGDWDDGIPNVPKFTVAQPTTASQIEKKDQPYVLSPEPKKFSDTTMENVKKVVDVSRQIGNMDIPSGLAAMGAPVPSMPNPTFKLPWMEDEVRLPSVLPGGQLVDAITSPVTQSMLSGALSGLRGFINNPSMLYDAISSKLKVSLDTAEVLEQLPTIEGEGFFEYQKRAEEFKKSMPKKAQDQTPKFLVDNPVFNLVEKLANSLNYKQRTYPGETWSSLREKGKHVEAADYMSHSVLENAYQIVPTVLIASRNPKMALSTAENLWLEAMAAMSQGQKDLDIRRNYPDIPTMKRLLNAFLIGRFEKWSEQLGTMGMFKTTRKIIHTFGLKAGKLALRNALRKTLVEGMPAIAANWVGEAMEEGWNSLAQDFTDSAFHTASDFKDGVVPHNKYFPRMLENMLVGAFSSMAMTTPMIVQDVQYRKDKQFLEKLLQDIKNNYDEAAFYKESDIEKRSAEHRIDAPIEVLDQKEAPVDPALQPDDPINNSRELKYQETEQKTTFLRGKAQVSAKDDPVNSRQIVNAAVLKKKHRIDTTKLPREVRMQLLAIHPAELASATPTDLLEDYTSKLYWLSGVGRDARFWTVHKIQRGDKTFYRPTVYSRSGTVSAIDQWRNERSPSELHNTSWTINHHGLPVRDSTGKVTSDPAADFENDVMGAIRGKVDAAIRNGGYVPAKRAQDVAVEEFIKQMDDSVQPQKTVARDVKEGEVIDEETKEKNSRKLDALRSIMNVHLRYSNYGGETDLEIDGWVEDGILTDEEASRIAKAIRSGDLGVTLSPEEYVYEMQMRKEEFAKFWEDLMGKKGKAKSTSTLTPAQQAIADASVKRKSEEKPGMPFKGTKDAESHGEMMFANGDWENIAKLELLYSDTLKRSETLEGQEKKDALAAAQLYREASEAALRRVAGLVYDHIDAGIPGSRWSNYDVETGERTSGRNPSEFPAYFTKMNESLPEGKKIGKKAALNIVKKYMARGKLTARQKAFMSDFLKGEIAEQMKQDRSSRAMGVASRIQQLELPFGTSEVLSGKKAPRAEEVEKALVLGKVPEEIKTHNVEEFWKHYDEAKKFMNTIMDKFMNRVNVQFVNFQLWFTEEVTGGGHEPSLSYRPGHPSLASVSRTQTDYFSKQELKRVATNALVQVGKTLADSTIKINVRATIERFNNLIQGNKVFSDPRIEPIHPNTFRDFRSTEGRIVNGVELNGEQSTFLLWATYHEMAHLFSGLDAKVMDENLVNLLALEYLRDTTAGETPYLNKEIDRQKDVMRGKAEGISRWVNTWFGDKRKKYDSSKKYQISYAEVRAYKLNKEGEREYEYFTTKEKDGKVVRHKQTYTNTVTPEILSGDKVNEFLSRKDIIIHDVVEVTTPYQIYTEEEVKSGEATKSVVFNQHVEDNRNKIGAEDTNTVDSSNAIETKMDVVDVAKSLMEQLETNDAKETIQRLIESKDESILEILKRIASRTQDPKIILREVLNDAKKLSGRNISTEANNIIIDYQNLEQADHLSEVFNRLLFAYTVKMEYATKLDIAKRLGRSQDLQTKLNYEMNTLSTRKEGSSAWKANVKRVQILERTIAGIKEDPNYVNPVANKIEREQNEFLAWLEEQKTNPEYGFGLNLGVTDAVVESSKEEFMNAESRGGELVEESEPSVGEETDSDFQEDSSEELLLDIEMPESFGPEALEKVNYYKTQILNYYNALFKGNQSFQVRAMGVASTKDETVIPPKGSCTAPNKLSSKTRSIHNTFMSLMHNPGGILNLGGLLAMDFSSADKSINNTANELMGEMFESVVKWFPGANKVAFQNLLRRTNWTVAGEKNMVRYLGYLLGQEARYMCLDSIIKNQGNEKYPELQNAFTRDGDSVQFKPDLVQLRLEMMLKAFEEVRCPDAWAGDKVHRLVKTDTGSGTWLGYSDSFFSEWKKKDPNAKKGDPRPELFWFKQLTQQEQAAVAYLHGRTTDIRNKMIANGLGRGTDWIGNTLAGYFPGRHRLPEAQKRYVESGSDVTSTTSSSEFRKKSIDVDDFIVRTRGTEQIVFSGIDAAIADYYIENMNKMVNKRFGEDLRRLQNIAGKPDLFHLIMFTDEIEKAMKDLGWRNKKGKWTLSPKADQKLWPSKTYDSTEAFIAEFLEYKKAPGWDILDRNVGKGQGWETPWIDRHLVPELNDLFKRGSVYSVIDGMGKFNYLTKLFIMYSPHFQSLQIMSNVLASGQGLFTGLKTAGEAIGNIISAVSKDPGALVGAVPYATTFNKKLRRDPFANFVKVGGYESTESMIQDMVFYGVQTANPNGVFNMLYGSQEIMDSNDPNKGIYGSLINSLGTTSHFLFGVMVNNMAAPVWVQMTKHLESKGMSVHRAKRLAAAYVNQVTNTPGMHLYGRENAVMNAMLFAKDFTVSTMRDITGALGLRGSMVQNIPIVGKYFKSFFFGELTRSELNALQPALAALTIKKAVLWVLISQLFQLAAKALNPDDDKIPAVTWENPERFRKMDVRIGTDKKTKRPVYLLTPFFQETQTLLNLFPRVGVFKEASKGARTTIANRASASVRLFTMIMSNYDVGKNQQVVIDSPDATANDYIAGVMKLGDIAIPEVLRFNRDENKPLWDYVTAYWGFSPSYGLAGFDGMADRNINPYEVFDNRAYQEDQMKKEKSKFNKTPMEEIRKKTWDLIRAKPQYKKSYVNWYQRRINPTRSLLQTAKSVYKKSSVDEKKEIRNFGPSTVTSAYNKLKEKIKNGSART